MTKYGAVTIESDARAHVVVGALDENCPRQQRPRRRFAILMTVVALASISAAFAHRGNTAMEFMYRRIADARREQSRALAEKMHESKLAMQREANAQRDARTANIVGLFKKNLDDRRAKQMIKKEKENASLGGVLSLIADGVSLAGSVATSVGDVASGGGDFCWKTTTTRGAGEIGYECDGYKDAYGNSYVAIGILCYPPCKPGYEHSSVYDCKQKCSDVDANYQDHPTAPMYCERKSDKTKSRKSVSPSCSSATASADIGDADDVHTGGSRKLLGSTSCTNCPSGYSMCGGTCRENCPTGYEPALWPNECSTCRADCSGFKDNDVFDGVCAKDWYSRIGEEKITGCPDGTSTDGGWGLCYPSCPDGKTGVGPVCWQETLIVDGHEWFNCGMGFATDEVTCALTTTDMVLGPLDVVICIASGLSACVASNVAGGVMSTAELVIENVGNIADAVCTVADAASVSRDLTSGSYDDPEDAARLAMEVAAAFDPTGVAGCVAAYTWPICDETALEETIAETPKCSHDRANAALEPSDGQDYLCYDPFVRYIRVEQAVERTLCLAEVIVKEKLHPDGIGETYTYDENWLESMPNIASDATVTSGSVRSGSSMANAIDGKSNWSKETIACTTNSPGKNWIQLDLGEPKAVYSVDLIAHSDKQWALKGAKVTFLNDQYEVLKLHELDDDGNRVEEYDDSGDPTGTAKIDAVTNIQFADDASDTITVVYDPIVYSEETIDDDTQWFYLGCSPLTPYFCKGGSYGSAR